MTPKASPQRVGGEIRAAMPGPGGTATGEWVAAAQARLLGHRGGATGWGYRPGTEPGVEPTVLASLGLLASGPDPSARLAARAAADWLAAIQNPNGSFGVSASLTDPGWTTPYALLLWQALGVQPDRRDRAAHWLLEQRGTTIPPGPGNVMGHDAMLVGWPWVAETHSWLEPTALAVLALRRQGLTDHPRARDGLRLVRDRAIASGGWNYGNNVVFGHQLRPQPAPTGLALLALAGVDRRTELVERAVRYLLGVLPTVRSAPSLCWGLLGLRAWGQRPEQSGAWLAEAYRDALRWGASAPRLGHLLLGVGDRALELLGISDEGRRHE